MLAGGAFSEFGFCEHSYTPLDSSAMDAMLAETPARRCWLLELDARTGAGGGHCQHCPCRERNAAGLGRCCWCDAWVAVG